jgi:hypothetical protein
MPKRLPTYEPSRPNGVKQTYSVRLTFATVPTEAGEVVPVHTTPINQLDNGLAAYRTWSVRKTFLSDNAARLALQTTQPTNDGEYVFYEVAQL